jgi:predicted protein tyrosine phosphatase
LDDAESRIFIHCAAGVHRAPMMALALGHGVRPRRCHGHDPDAPRRRRFRRCLRR